jgi:hypothetical protein
MTKRLRNCRMPIAAALAVLGTPLLAHHSFAPFDQTKVRIVTGVVTRVNPDANHLQIYFAPMNDERRNVQRDDANNPVIYEVEMAGSAASAADGVSVASFPQGTVFSVAYNPTRNGDKKGLRQGPMYKCPVGANGKPVPPKAGQHCDAVEGNTKIGQGSMPAPTE